MHSKWNENQISLENNNNVKNERKLTESRRNNNNGKKIRIFIRIRLLVEKL